ncbi:error-prone DNA polymerase [Myxococcota bacterium]
MFAELLARSCFSFLRGASQPEELVQRARELELAAIALCDHDGLYGSVRAWAQARQLGQRLLVGAEITLSVPAPRNPTSQSPSSINSREPAPAARVSQSTSSPPANPDVPDQVQNGPATRPDLSAIDEVSCLPGSVIVSGPSDDRTAAGAPDPRALSSADPLGTPAFATPPQQDYTVAILAADYIGYQNLCSILTLAHTKAPKGRSAITLPQLAEHSAGLIAILPAPRIVHRSQIVPELFGTIRESFGQRAWLGVYRYLERHDRARVMGVADWSRRYGLPILASSRPLYHDRSRKHLADVLHCIRTKTTLASAGSELSINAEAVLRSEQAMHRLFPGHPEWVQVTAEVAQEVRFGLNELRYHFPCDLAPGETADHKLRRLVCSGAKRRYRQGIPCGVVKQLRRELRLIAQLGMAAYFLSAWEVVEMARQRRILCQGRGSAANSAVCYVLGITAVDPARSNLLFERFMSAERTEPPDIDIDFEHERREEVIQAIYQRYGRDRAAMVSEVICYRGKSALRDVGKVLGLSLEQVSRLTANISGSDSVPIARERAAEVGLDLQSPTVTCLFDVAQILQGFPRHLSIHVGGFVLSSEPLTQIAPVEPAHMAGRTIIPWDKDDLEVLGFFKVDVLGLGILTAIRKCLELVVESGGLDWPNQPFDPLEAFAHIPAEDPAVYRMMAQADTVGVFQVESRAQMTMLPRLRPVCFYDLVIEVAIVRPGPIQGGMVHPYLRRRNGSESVAMPHPALRPILERTLGVPLFQEQVMQIAMVGAGYSGGEADELRRDMAAWHRSGRLLRHRDRLLEGFRQRGVSRRFGEALFEQIKGFGEYGFPESHAASFALLVYASGWLKAHYPAHFTCALLNSQPMGFYSPSTLVQDVVRHGVEVRDVCVTKSFWDCSLERVEVDSSVGLGDPGCVRALRLGLRLVKGLHRFRVKRLLTERTGRPWSDWQDVAERGGLAKNEIEMLAQAGALGKLVSDRRQALWSVSAPRVGGLFAGCRLDEPQVELPLLTPVEQLVFDYARKGLSVGDHPLCHLRSSLTLQAVLTAQNLGRAESGQKVRVAGLVTCRQQPGTASGVIFLTLEDETGVSNLIVRPRVFVKYRREVLQGTLLLAAGRVERGGPVGVDAAVVHLVVTSLQRLVAPQLRLPALSRDFF